MLDKLEKLVNTLKQVVLFILAPLITALYLLPLLTKKRTSSKDEGEQVVVLDELKGAIERNEAIQAAESYRELRDRYLREHSSEQKP